MSALNTKVHVACRRSRTLDHQRHRHQGKRLSKKKKQDPPPKKKEWQAQQADAGPAADPSPPATPPSWLQAKKTIHKVTQA